MPSAEIPELHEVKMNSVCDMHNMTTVRWGLDPGIPPSRTLQFRRGKTKFKMFGHKNDHISNYIAQTGSYGDLSVV